MTVEGLKNLPAPKLSSGQNEDDDDDKPSLPPSYSRLRHLERLQAFVEVEDEDDGSQLLLSLANSGQNGNAKGKGTAKGNGNGKGKAKGKKPKTAKERRAQAEQGVYDELMGSSDEAEEEVPKGKRKGKAGQSVSRASRKRKRAKATAANDNSDDDSVQDSASDAADGKPKAGVSCCILLCRVWTTRGVPCHPVCADPNPRWPLPLPLAPALGHPQHSLDAVPCACRRHAEKLTCSGFSL